jgi:hypothetical protein
VIQRVVSILFILFVACGLYAVNAPAQQPTQSRTQTPAPSTSTPPPGTTSSAADDSADLSITANVTARSLRFDAVPNPNVEFNGHPARITVWNAERQNLPRPVQPGVTYRNIGIQLKITSVFADIDRIVAEALGEVPVRDNAPTQENAPPQNDALPSPQTNAPPAAATPSTPASTPSSPAATRSRRRRPR